MQPARSVHATRTEPRECVHVVGNIALDLTFRLPALPRPGETLLGEFRGLGLGGKGANQAVAAARAGAAVTLCAPVGDDADGRWARARLQRESLELWLVAVDAPTDRSIVYVADDGENCVVSTAAAARGLTEDLVRPAIGTIRGGDILLVQGNLRRSVTAFALEEARRRGARTVLNPAPVAFPCEDLWPWVDVAVMNAAECGRLCGGAPDVLLRYGVGTVVVTLGAQGCRLVTRDDDARLPARRVEPVDTTGAGDAFCGVLAAGLALGLPFATAATWAQRAAAHVVTRPGAIAALPTARRCRRWLVEVGGARPWPGRTAGPHR